MGLGCRDRVDTGVVRGAPGRVHGPLVEETEEDTKILFVADALKIVNRRQFFPGRYGRS